MKHPGTQQQGRSDGVRLALRLALRGIAYRRLTAAVVLVLAVVAATAAVVAPLYSRAAEESIARSALAGSDVFARAVHADVSANGARVALPASGTVDSLAQRLHGPVFGRPVVSSLTGGIATSVGGPQAGGEIQVPLVERVGLCQHLPLTTGRCATKADEAVLTTRSAALLGLHVGDELTVGLTDVQRADGSQQIARLTVVGTTDPFDLDDDFWVGRPLFRYYPVSRPSGLGELPPLTDTVFMGDGAAKALGVVQYSVDVPVDGRAIGLDDGPAVASTVDQTRVELGKVAVAVTSQLPTLVATSAQRSDVVRVAAPLAAFQLVLLAWVILAHVVSSATQERAPELGLAKLRGLTPPRTVRFGLGEVGVLLLVSAPIGTVLGWLVVHEVAVHLLEPGIPLRLTPAVVVSVVLGVLGGIGAAAVAARGVARGHVADLLRRVPGSGHGRRAGAVEGVVLALVVAGVVQLAVAPGSAPGPVASAGPGMIALGGALLAARLLRWVSRRRVARALERGRAAPLIGWAGVARRAGTARTTGVLAAALCLLLIGVQAWTVASRERHARALAETGAAVVLDVGTTTPAGLMAAVRGADPGGRYAMAAVGLPGSNDATPGLAVDATRADAVLGFGGRGPGPVRGVLRPPLPASTVLRPGVVEVRASTTALDSPSPLVLSATLETSGGWVEADLGALRRGPQTYRGTVPSTCARGCRLVALTVRHPAIDIVTGRATVTFTAMSAGPAARPQPLDAGFDRAGAWRPPVVDAGGASAPLHVDHGLVAEVTTPVGFPARVFHGDAPYPVPSLGGPDTPARDGAVHVTGLDGVPTTLHQTRVADFVPGLGRGGALTDLDLMLRSVPASQADVQQVWLARDDPSAERALRTALTSSGITVTGRTSAAQALDVLDREGAVLALLLFLACGGVAVVVAVGALLVAAFVGARARAAEVSALRTVGVRRGLLRRALLVENVAGVLVSLVCAVAAAAVAVVVVLPVLPLADEDSSVLVPRTGPDLLAGAWSVAGVAVLLVALAVLIASAQLRGGSAGRSARWNG